MEVLGVADCDKAILKSSRLANKLIPKLFHTRREMLEVRNERYRWASSLSSVPRNALKAFHNLSNSIRSCACVVGIRSYTVKRPIW